MSVNPIQEKTKYIQLFSYSVNFFIPRWGEKIHPYIYKIFIYIGVDLIPTLTQGNFI